MEQISYLHGVLVEVSDHIDGLSGLLLNGTFLDVEDSLSHLSELLLLGFEVEFENTSLHMKHGQRAYLDAGEGLSVVHAEVGGELVADHVSSPIFTDTLGNPLVESLFHGAMGRGDIPEWRPT